jgi:DNA-binding MarR family transcriptional regulator|tara:strand:- start:5404 stop:5622 length:219 start_codon:yes stop_codon:yes gene_type:complete
MSLNTEHNLTLTEGQISTILYTMEGYMQGSDDNEDSQFVKDVDTIFEILEGTIDKHYDKIEKARSKQPEMEW